MSLSSINQWWREHGGNPLLAGLGAAALAGGATYALTGPMVETGKALGRPLVVPLLAGLDPSRFGEANETWESGMDNFQHDWKRRLGMVGLIGGLGLGGTLYAAYNPAKRFGGLLGDDTPFGKRASFDPETSAFDEPSYLQDIDWSSPIRASVARELMADPRLQGTYAGLAGTAIVNAAAGNDLYTTAGRVYDVARDKIDTHLTFGGVARAATRAVLANAGARMLAGALDSVCGLPETARDAIVSAGTWAGAVSSILE